MPIPMLAAAMPPLLTPLLAELSAHDFEMAETLIGVGRFMLIFVAARALAEVLVRFQLPTILGELLAGVLIGASGLHLLVPPETRPKRIRELPFTLAFDDLPERP